MDSVINEAIIFLAIIAAIFAVIGIVQMLSAQEPPGPGGAAEDEDGAAPHLLTPTRRKFPAIPP